MSNFIKRFVPLMDRVLVKKIKPELQTKSGIFLPDAAKAPSNMATVIAVGSGRVLKSGEKIPCGVNKGDTVVIPEYGGLSVRADDEEYHVLRDDDIIGIIKE